MLSHFGRPGGCAGEYNVSTANGPSYPVSPDYSLQGPAGIGDPGFATDVGGRWFHDGRPTSIEIAPDGRNLTIINEWGQRSNGYVAGRHELVIPSLGITGRLGHGEGRISWSNGTEWTR
jgi:hypothetical protein